jgi:Domain of unknown function (DUF4386)
MSTRLTLRQAALTAGFFYLLMPVSYAEFTIYPKLVIPGNIALTVFGSGPLHAQVELLLHSFRYDWSLSLVIFGIHLILLGYLIYRSAYIPKLIGILLVIDGLGWIINCLQPYLYPSANLNFIFVTFFGELIFMLWLLIFGWRIREPAI